MKQIPNIITLSRVVFLGIIAWLAFETWAGAATITFVCAFVAAMSDWLDGWVARKWGYITNFGKLMDALVDKIMVVGLFLVLYYAGLLSMGNPWLEVLAWVIIIATILRDVAITGIRMVVARKGVVLAADKAGKRKAIWQITAICVLFFVPVVQTDLQPLLKGRYDLFTTWVWANGIIYFILGGVLTVYSGVHYMIRYAPYLRPGATGPSGS